LQDFLHFYNGDSDSMACVCWWRRRRDAHNLLLLLMLQVRCRSDGVRNQTKASTSVWRRTASELPTRTEPTSTCEVCDVSRVNRTLCSSVIDVYVRVLMSTFRRWNNRIKVRKHSTRSILLVLMAVVQILSPTIIFIILHSYPMPKGLNMS